MRISTTTHYASRILLDLALHLDQPPVSATKLSEHTGIPVKFLEKIVRPLKSAGFVKSVRGAMGGHYLACMPEDITLGSVVRLMDGGIRLAQCGVEDGQCSKQCHQCRTNVIWREVAEALERELDAITLADMLGEHQAACWRVGKTGTEG